jgi:predicted small metal-binding protein
VLAAWFATLFTGGVAVLAHRTRRAYREQRETERRQQEAQRSAEHEATEHIRTYVSEARLAELRAPEDDEPLTPGEDAAIEQGRPKVINCECGFTVRGATDDELIANAEEHISHDHPEAIGKITRKDLLDMTEEAY